MLGRVSCKHWKGRAGRGGAVGMRTRKATQRQSGLTDGVCGMGQSEVIAGASCATGGPESGGQERPQGQGRSWRRLRP